MSKVTKNPPTLPLYDISHKPIVGQCKICSGAVRRMWRSKLRLSEYSCDSCGRCTPTFDGQKTYPEPIIKETFDTIYDELISSGIKFPQVRIVCRLVMTQLHIPKFRIKSLQSWGYFTDSKGRLHKYDRQKQ